MWSYWWKSTNRNFSCHRWYNAVVIGGKVENLVREIVFLKVGFLKPICFWKLFEEEAEKEKGIIRHEEIKSFQDKKWFDWLECYLIFWLNDG